MTEMPPLMRDQSKVDAEQLKLLGIFHFVLAGLSIVGLCFLFLHWAVMHGVMDNPEMWKNAKAAPPPETILTILRWFYLVMGSVILTMAAGNFLSGWFLLKRRARTFSLLMAGVNCVGFPFGTTLAVFSFLVLLRQSVAELYVAARSPTSFNSL